jgi:SNF family Na+-dependent transporter
LGVAVGSQLLLSSYNGFNANAHRDALFIAFGNSATSMYAGVVVFGVVGFIANQGPVL